MDALSSLFSINLVEFDLRLVSLFMIEHLVVERVIWDELIMYAPVAGERVIKGGFRQGVKAKKRVGVQALEGMRVCST